MATTDIAGSAGKLKARLGQVLGRVSLLNAALVGLGAILFLALCWALLVTDPFGGQPVARVALNAAQPPRTGGDNGAAAPALRPDAQDANTPSASERQIPLPEDAGGQVVISDPISGAIDGNVALIESSRHGPLPKIAKDGRRPLEVYGRAVPKLAAGQPRVALVVTGMGLSAAGTENAIRKLPADVTFAFAPYGRDLRRLARLARTDGHELILQAPLEPYGYPDNDPGPHTLLTTLPERQNVDRLHWVMARMVGYVGVMNHMGAKFIADEGALNPVLTDLRNRGLMYLDDGSAPQAKAAPLAERLGLAYLKADQVIDVDPSRDAIDAALSDLLELASDRGYAVGVISALPGSVSALENWIGVLEQRNVAIVPVSALLRPAPS